MDRTGSDPAGATVTPTEGKTPARSSRSTSGENLDPNVRPRLKFFRSPPIAKPGNLAVPKKGFPNQAAFPSSSKKKDVCDRKFVVVKRKLRKEEAGDSSRPTVVCEKAVEGALTEFFCESLSDSQDTEVFSNEENGEIGWRNSRDSLMEAARQSIPESGSGRVMHLVMAFEKLLMIPKSDEERKDGKKVMKWALPGLQQTEVSDTEVSSMFNPSDLFLTPERFGMDSGCPNSMGSGKRSISERSSSGGRKTRLSSNESSGTVGKRNGKRKQQKETAQKPFMLRTEQRGRSKEEQFTEKLQKLLEEEEKLRRPVALDLPWTTDEPEFLSKPLVKENTRPVDLVLHSDVRAVERTEFDNQVVKKMNLIEQYRVERERQQKEAEEEEIKRLRKELVPKAQPLPYFNRPFIPTRSMKQLTVPKGPKFHLPQNKKIKYHSDTRLE